GLGGKQLRHYASPELFRFGSESRASRATRLIPRHVDMAGLASYLAFGAVQDRFTIIEGVRSRHAGHTLVWENNHNETRRYWCLAEVASRPMNTDNLSEAAEAVRDLVQQAVSQRLISDVPIVIFLRGGLDSSS